MAEPVINPAAAIVGEDGMDVPRLLKRRVELSGDATFLSFGDRSWTYAEADREIDAAADLIAGRCSSRVVSYLDNRPEAIWIWLGTLVAGRQYLPLNRTHKGLILKEMIDRSGAELMITDRAGLAELPGLADSPLRSLGLLAGPGVEGDPVDLPAGDVELFETAEEVAGRPGQRRRVGPADVAELMFTSGTTGRSKAVQMTHRGLCRGAGWTAWGAELTPSDVVHCWLPLYHAAAQVDFVLAAIVAGARVALFERFSLSRFWGQVEESGATVFGGFTNILYWLHERADLAPRSSSLRIAFVGGIPIDLHSDFESRFGVRLLDIYGMTELEPIALPHPGDQTPIGSVGRPVPDLEVAVLGEDGDRLAPGSIGEIVARPKQPDIVTPGYEGDDAATLETFANLWFHTGDLGRIDEAGYLYFVDRAKHAIRRGGENISSVDLEGVLLNHEGIVECAVVGVEDTELGQEVKAVVVTGDDEATEPSIHAWASENLASFMVPRYIELLPELPRDAAGKVRKLELGKLTPGVWDARGDRSVDYIRPPAVKSRVKTKPGDSQFDLALERVKELAAMEGHLDVFTGTGTRSRILAAAIRLFGEYGYEGASMRDLAAAVDLKPAAIYNYFTSKDDLLVCALRYGIGRFLLVILDQVEPGEPEEQLEGMVRRHVLYQLENIELERVTDTLISKRSISRLLSAEDAQQLFRAQRGYVTVVEELAAKIMPKPGVDPAVIAFGIIALCDRVSSWFDEEGSLSPEEVADQTWILVRRLLAQD